MNCELFGSFRWWFRIGCKGTEVEVLALNKDICSTITKKIKICRSKKSSNFDTINHLDFFHLLRWFFVNIIFVFANLITLSCFDAFVNFVSKIAPSFDKTCLQIQYQYLCFTFMWIKPNFCDSLLVQGLIWLSL